SGLYTTARVGELVRETHAATSMAGFLDEMRIQLANSYGFGATALNEMVATFEVGYPFGLATVDAQTRALALWNTFQKIQLATDEMRGLISATVQQGVWMNLRPFEVMQQLTHIMGIRDIPGFRELGTTGITAKAERIVRTEMMTAQNMGYWDALQQAGETFPDLFKVWMATGDMRTRTDHLDAHSQQQKWDEDFVVGGETCVGPHDPSLSPRNRINCRCRSVPYREEWGPLSELTGLIDEQVALEKSRRSEGPTPTAELGSMKPSISGAQESAIWRKQNAWYHEGLTDIGANATVVGEKKRIASELATQLGIPEDQAAEFIRTWASTSNQGLRSMQM
ncbi:hypothetical protein LCGC14_3147130, partial [marine sediment metagenome]